MDMNKESSENQGFLSRMTALELKLKQSEDERLALEEKFNKLLNARKSEEEMQLYQLRENYSQLLKKDRMRCDRNDMILQSLANIENRALMLTAKTDRLRLLRQHYESYMSRNHPVIKRSVIRHRSAENLISDIHELVSPQRSMSSSPRRMSSYSPSPFTRSPSLTRRNSLVVPDSEILEFPSYKVPNKTNLTTHPLRRILFEDSPRVEKSLNSKTFSRNLSSLRDDVKDISFKSQMPTVVVSSSDHEQLALPVNRNTSNDLFLPIPSYSDNINKYLSKDEFSSREPTLTKTNQSLRSNSPKTFEKLSPPRSTMSSVSPRSSFAKPLTKSSSFSTGSTYSRNVSNSFSPERRSFVRRPSFVYRSTVPIQHLNRFQVPVLSSVPSQSPFERSRSPLSERSRSAFSERAKSPLSDRNISPLIGSSKSPLKVVDDIFKKYLINYDKSYLSDPISESKYGKYLYPLSNYEYTYSEDLRRKPLSNLLEPKYDTRTMHYDDNVSISSRESVLSNHYKPFRSYDSEYINDRQHSFHERHLSHPDEATDWKEWNHYRNRYMYPPAADFEPTFGDDLYFPITSQIKTREPGKTAPYDFGGDLPIKYSDSFDTLYENSKHLEKDVEHTTSSQYQHKSKESLPIYERKISSKQEFDTKDTFKMPQTPKKVSFSNEFLYDDKSDPEVSSNLDESITLFDDKKCAEITEKNDFTSSEKNSLKLLDQNRNLNESTNDISRNIGENLKNKDAGQITSDKTDSVQKDVTDINYSTKENSLVKEEKDLENKTKSETSDMKNINFKDESNKIKALTSNDAQEYKVTDSLNDASQLPSSQGVSSKSLEPSSLDLLKETFSTGDSATNKTKERDSREIEEGFKLLEDNGTNEEDITEKHIYGDNEKHAVGGKNISLVESKIKDSQSLSPDPSIVLKTTYGGTVESDGKTQLPSKNNDSNEEKIFDEKSKENSDYIDENSTQLNYNNSETFQKQVPAEFVTDETVRKGHEEISPKNLESKENLNVENKPDEDGYSKEHHLVYDSPHEQKETYDGHIAQQYHDGNIYENADIPEYASDYSREQYEQPQPQYDQYGQQPEGYMGEEYVQPDVSEYDQTQELYAPEQYGEKDYQEQPKVYAESEYEQQAVNYNAEGYSQQNVQDYQQPLPQQQFEEEKYIPQDQYDQQYKESDQSQYSAEHYPPENLSQGYTAEQPYEGEYPPEYVQPQPYETNYQEPVQDPQVASEQYKAEYDTPYQDDSQYNYDQLANTYDEQYEQHGQQYDQHQQPYKNYEQQPEHYDEQYQAPADQYGNYDYTYDEQNPVAEQAYLGPDQQSYAGGPQPYNYNEPLQQPYDDVQPYSENVPYEGMQQPYPDDQSIFRDEQQLYETSDSYIPQDLDTSQHENIPPEYDYPLQTESSHPSDGQLLPQADEGMLAPNVQPYTETVEPNIRESFASEVLASDHESSVPRETVIPDDLSTSHK